MGRLSLMFGLWGLAGQVLNMLADGKITMHEIITTIIQGLKLFGLNVPADAVTIEIPDEGGMKIAVTQELLDAADVEVNFDV